MFDVLEKINERPEPFQFYTASDLWTDEHTSKQMLSYHLSEDIDLFRDRYSRLTPRELNICELIRSGKSSKQIASNLNISLGTVNKHREQIRRKLGISNKEINLGTYLKLYY